MLGRIHLSGRTDLLDNHQLATRRRPSRPTGAIAIFGSDSSLAGHWGCPVGGTARWPLLWPTKTRCSWWYGAATPSGWVHGTVAVAGWRTWRGPPAGRYRATRWADGLLKV